MLVRISDQVLEGVRLEEGRLNAALDDLHFPGDPDLEAERVKLDLKSIDISREVETGRRRKQREIQVLGEPVQPMEDSEGRAAVERRVLEELCCATDRAARSPAGSRGCARRWSSSVSSRYLASMRETASFIGRPRSALLQIGCEQRDPAEPQCRRYSASRPGRVVAQRRDRSADRPAERLPVA